MPREKTYVPATKPTAAFTVYSPFSSPSLMCKYTPLVDKTDWPKSYVREQGSLVPLPSMATTHESIFLRPVSSIKFLSSETNIPPLEVPPSGSKALLPKTVSKQLRFYGNINQIPLIHTPRFRLIEH